MSLTVTVLALCAPLVLLGLALVMWALEQRVVPVRRSAPPPGRDDRPRRPPDGADRQR